MDDLRTYFLIIRRWWWVAAIPVVLVSALTARQLMQPETVAPANVTHEAVRNFVVGLPPVETGASSDFDPINSSWKTSEYMVAGMYDWVRSRGFAESVQVALAADGIDYTVDELETAIDAGFARSRFDLIVELDTPDNLAAIVDASTEILQTQNNTIFTQNGGVNMTVIPLGDAQIETVVAPGISVASNSLLDAIIRVGLALVFGLLLAFLAFYFDPKIRTKRELEELGLSLVGEIPRGSR